MRKVELKVTRAGLNNAMQISNATTYCEQKLGTHWLLVSEPGWLGRKHRLQADLEKTE